MVELSMELHTVCVRSADEAPAKDFPDSFTQSPSHTGSHKFFKWERTLMDGELYLQPYWTHLFKSLKKERPKEKITHQKLALGWN